jgi:AraC family transcriptional regulator of adaptative response/methylated-DNA-[protein]-cysteine methyltransferase
LKLHLFERGAELPGLKPRIGKTPGLGPFKVSVMNHDELLQAIMARDARLDGTFVYGISSTRIYCRPSCPSKRPKQENITLFGTIEAASAAGFRACLRCRPDEFAARIGEGEASLKGHELKAAAGVSARDLAENERMERFKQEIRSGGGVLAAGLEAGFGSTRALYERAPSHLGMTPATYGKGGAGAEISFATAPCDLGYLLVARTEVGVCSVALGDDPQSLERALRKEFFAAHIERDYRKLVADIEVVLLHLQGNSPSVVLPLDLRATAFQWRVWKELTRLQRGETVSYGELASRLEMPGAVRAVASACGKNPVALVHPCHRVVGKSGEMTGYRWGIERKKRLLESEKSSDKTK